MTRDGSLPEGWRWAKFGDVVRQVKDRVDPREGGVERYVAGQHMVTDELRIPEWGEITNDYLGPAFHMRFQPGHVLYGSRRTYLRKVAVADFEGVCANTTFVLEPKSDALLPEFLPLVMSATQFHDHSVQQSKGSVNPYVNWKDLAWYEFPLPPLPDQQRFVQLIDAIELQRQRLGCVVPAAQDLASAVVADVARDEHRVQPLADCCRHRISYGIVQPGDLVDGGVPFINVEDMTAGQLEPSSLPTTSPEISEKHRRTVLGAKDVIVALRGPIGLTAIVDDRLSGANLSRGVARLSPRPSLDSGYLAACFQSAFVRSQIRRSQTGTTFSELKIGALRELKIPLPDLDVQKAVASRVASARRVAAEAELSARRLLELRRQLLSTRARGR